VLTWLGSAKNIAGCTGALGGVALTAAGLIQAPYWPLAIAGLYGVGALAAPPRRNPPAGGRLDVGDLRSTAEAQLAMVIGRAPVEVVSAAERVVEALRELFERPNLLPAGAPETFVVERTVADYLPAALEAYLDLPPTFAATHRLPDGRTPRQVVVDQLTLLERGVREVTEAAARGDTSRLLAHGRFLADRFGPHELLVPPPEQRPAAERPDPPA
jgi:hypothetical protein